MTTQDYIALQTDYDRVEADLRAVTTWLSQRARNARLASDHALSASLHADAANLINAVCHAPTVGKRLSILAGWTTLMNTWKG